MNTKELAEAMLDGSLNYVPEDDAWHVAEEYLKLEKELQKYKNFVAQISGNNLLLNNQLKAAIEIGKQNHAKIINALAKLEGGSE